MKTKKQLRIIAVRPLNGCAPHILKVLKENTTYFLYNDYEEDINSKTGIRKRKNKTYSEVPEDFFSSGLNNNAPQLSISAIVGKNGDGKSSIIELFMRVLSNFSYASGYLKDHNDLKAIEGVFAVVYYSIGNSLYTLESNGKTLKLSSDCIEKDYTFNIDNPIKEISELKEIEDHLFYTQVSNYSLYAYNAREFHKEFTPTKECWINGIFHKNDGYQTPIVLNPWRDNGVIDINKENDLIRQRLTSLFVTNDSFRKINEKQEAISLKLSLFKNSKLEDKSLYDFFKATLNIDHSLHIESKMGLQQIQNESVHYDKINKGALNDRVSTLISMFKSINEFIKQERALIKRAISIRGKLIDDIRKERNEPQWLPQDTDIEQIISSAEKLFSKYQDLPMLTTLIDIINELKTSDIQHLNSTQFMRIVLISAYRYEWTKECDVSQLNSAIGEKVYDYLVYKSISIVEKYPQYREFNKNYYFTELICDENQIHRIRETCSSVIKKVTAKDKSHVTLKLRQTLNFVNFEPQYKYIYSEINDGSDTVIGFSNYRDRLNTIPEHKNGKLDTIELLPPPIFKIDINIKQTDSEKYTSLSELSSGERQELNSISSVIYHLQNISSISNDKDMIKYKYINLIFEEIELYFHPEFQRQYIKRLIEQISTAKLDDIHSINMCFVTHSPFILSDIPTRNILKLENGKPILEEEKSILTEQTFGENIHELLANKFFLENSFMGEFAKNKINSLIEYLVSDTPNQNTPWNDKKAKDVIRIIAEPVLQERLQMLYDKKIQWKDQEYIRERIKYLESKLEK